MYLHLKQSYKRTRVMACFESKLVKKIVDMRIPVLEIENLTRRVSDEIGRVNARQGARTAQVAGPIQSLISPCLQTRKEQIHVAHDECWNASQKCRIRIRKEGGNDDWTLHTSRETTTTVKRRREFWHTSVERWRMSYRDAGIPICLAKLDRVEKGPAKDRHSHHHTQ